MKIKISVLVLLTIICYLCKTSETAEQRLGQIEGLNDVLDDQLEFLQDTIQKQDDLSQRIENANPEELGDLLKELQSSLSDVFGDDVDGIIQELENDAKAFREEIPTEEEIQNYNANKSSEFLHVESQ